ncbi:MAG TPA: vWA domain-containing protein, partial [Spirochaetota bacterium]|nr:vWA domain-containing protein [Spirochaetota bacterium]
MSIEKIEYDTTTSSVGISCVVNSSLTVSRDSLCIFQDGNLVKDFSIAPGTERSQTVYIVLAFDCSKSLSSKDLSGIKRTASDFISSVDNIQISILKFENNVMRVQPFTSGGNSFIRSIDDLKRSGKKTKLYDAVYEGIKLLESTDSSVREIIVFTDGKDEGSSVTADDVINQAKSAKVPVFFWSVGKGRKLEAIKRIAVLTGGDCFSGGNSGRSLSTVIIKNPKRSYLLSYKADNQVSGYHTVEVQLMSKDILGRDISQYKSDPDKDIHPVMDRMLIVVTA